MLRMYGLVTLPRDVIFNIAAFLNSEDVYSLSLVCRELEWVVINESLCKLLVEVVAHLPL